MQKLILPIVFFLFSFTISYSQQKNTLVNPAKVLEAASVLDDSSQYNLAIDTLLTINKGDTSYLQVLTELAYNYLCAKKYTEAINTANKALGIPSNYHHRLILIKGNAYDDGGKPDSAILTYTEALKKYPYSYLIYYNLGITNMNAKRYDKSIEALQQAIIRNPLHASSHLALGRLTGLMGQYVHAMLCLETYLIIEPGTERSNKNLLFLNDLVNNSLSSDFEKIEPATDNKAFEETDQLIKAGIAMNKGYKAKIKFNAPIAKQTQLLFESLQCKQNTGDFWMDYYVPFFTAIKENNHFENFSYSILSSTPDENVASQLKSRKKELKEMSVLLYNKLLNFSKNQKIIENGKERMVDFFFDNNNYLVAVGNKAADGTTRQGHWNFFYPNCEPKAEGIYTDDGKLEGKWLNYNDNGILTYIENYSKGDLQGDYTGYYESGNKKYAILYNKNIITGDVTRYYDCNAISSVIHFENGNRNGKGKLFYKNGVVKEEFFYTDDSLDRESKGFYPQGSPKWLYNYKNNKIDGKTFDYYRNGKINTEYTYTMGQKNGLYQSYYKNGRMSNTGSYKNDNKVGLWKEFNNRGILIESSMYNEKGELHGENKGWDNSGNLYFTYVYNNGKLKEQKYFDTKGNILSTTKISDKTTPVKGYYTDGSILFEGSYTNGDMDGTWKYFFKCGKVKTIKKFKKGYLDGPFISFYTSGIKNEECYYTEGQLNGYYKKYFSNGNIKSEGWYVDGNQEGMWYYRNADGTLNGSMNILNGEINGYSDSYSPDQKLQISSGYKDGRIISMTTYDNNGAEISNVVFDGTKNYELYYHDKKIRATCDFSCNNLHSKFTFLSKEGKTESEYNYLNDEKDGNYISYYPSGTIKREGFYEEGKSSGLWKYYNEQGKLTKKGYFTDSDKDSIWTGYYENGKVRYINKFDEGQPIDTAYFYDITGELMYSLIYNDFELSGYQYIGPDGKKTININPKDTGIIITYYKNGKISSEQSYKYGELEGKQVIYFSNGNKYREFNLNNDQYNGTFTEFFENGKEKYIENFLFGDYHGICKYFRTNGSLERIEEYKYDDEHGSFIFFNEQGKIVKEQKYWASILLN